MAKRKQSWQSGDGFLAPLSDSSFAQGQVIVARKHAMNSVACAFFSHRYPEAPTALKVPEAKDLIAVLYVTRDLLDSGHWRVVPHQRAGLQQQLSEAFYARFPHLRWRHFVDIDELKPSGYVGLTIHGSANVTSFLNAFHKLSPWNDFFDPNYLDGLLISKDRKPTDLLLK